jgi:hypothetical protein
MLRKKLRGKNEQRQKKGKTRERRGYNKKRIGEKEQNKGKTRERRGDNKKRIGEKEWKPKWMKIEMVHDFVAQDNKVRVNAAMLTIEAAKSLSSC